MSLGPEHFLHSQSESFKWPVTGPWNPAPRPEGGGPSERHTSGTVQLCSSCDDVSLIESDLFQDVYTLEDFSYWMTFPSPI
jgi:hypothetical protein